MRGMGTPSLPVGIVSDDFFLSCCTCIADRSGNSSQLQPKARINFIQAIIDWGHFDINGRATEPCLC